MNIPFPTKTHRKKRQSFKDNTQKNEKGKRKGGGLPRFPKKPEALVVFERLSDRIKQLEDYLNNLLSINIYRNHPATVSLFLIQL